MGDGDGRPEPPGRRLIMRRPGPLRRGASTEVDPALVDEVRGLRERMLERETERHLREPEPGPVSRPRSRSGSGQGRGRGRGREAGRDGERQRAPDPSPESARTPQRGTVPGPRQEAAQARESARIREAAPDSGPAREPAPARDPAPVPRTPSPEARRAERGTDEGETARREAVYRALERSTGPMLPVLPWQSTPPPPPARPTPTPPAEYLPPETVTSDPTLPPRSFEPPRAYYTPTEPPPPQPPPPMSPPPVPMSYAPDHPFPEDVRIAQAEQARERARRRLEFAQRYGTTEPLVLEGADGRPVLIAPDLPPPRDPEEVARDVVLGTWALIQEGAEGLTGLSEELREASLDLSDGLREANVLRRWIEDHRRELQAAEVLLDVPGFTDTLLDLVTFLESVLAQLMGAGTGFARGALELLPGILSLLQMLYGVLQWGLLEGIEWNAGLASPVVEQTPYHRGLLEERRRWVGDLDDGLRRALDAWQAEYEAASPDRRANMIGQIIGQILFEIATARATAPRTPTGGAGTATAGAAAAEAELVVTGVTADGAAVAGRTVPIQAALSEAADRLGTMLVQLGPPPVLAAEGAAMMSLAHPPGDPPSPTAPRATTSRATTGRGTGGGARGTRPRHPSPPRPTEPPTPPRRLSRAARRRLADRLTTLEAQALRRIPLLRRLEDVQRRIRAAGVDPADVPPASALGREQAELLRRLGLEGVQRGEDAVAIARLRIQGMVRSVRELRRSARALRLDDDALQALLDMDLDDHTAMADTAFRVRGGHRRGYSRRYLREGRREPLELAPEDSAAMASTREGVASNIAGALVERLGQRLADARALDWARTQARRLGLAGEPVRGRLYAYRYATRPIPGTDRVRRVIERTEIGDPGAYVVPGEDGLTLLVFPESKLSDVLTVTSADIAAQTAGAMRRTREGIRVEFIADDGRVFDCPPGGVDAGRHTMLVTHGTRDGGTHAFASLPEGFGAHEHFSVALTREQARELAYHYAAAVPETRAMPTRSTFQPLPELAADPPP